MNNQLFEKLKSQVETGEIAQIPTWQVLAKHYVLWGFVGLSVIFSGLALSRIFFLLDTSDILVFKHISPNISQFLLNNLPYAWMLLATLFIFLSVQRFRETEFGYRYTTHFLVSIAVLSSILLGLVLYIIGMGKFLERVEFSKRENLWQNAAQGRIMGTVSSISTSTVVLIDSKGRAWQVIYGPQTVGKKMLIQGEEVRMVGFLEDDTATGTMFVGCAVMPRDGRPVSHEFINRVLEKQDDLEEVIVATSSSPEEANAKLALLQDCREVLEKGRAQFVPPAPHKLPPQADEKLK